jgi:hypothetical protein
MSADACGKCGDGRKAGNVLMLVPQIVQNHFLLQVLAGVAKLQKAVGCLASDVVNHLGDRGRQDHG